MIYKGFFRSVVKWNHRNVSRITCQIKKIWLSVRDPEVLSGWGFGETGIILVSKTSVLCSKQRSPASYFWDKIPILRSSRSGSAYE